MNWIYWVAQGIGALAGLAYLYATIKHLERGPILFINIIVNLLWAVHYSLLGAWTGMAGSVLTAFMFFVFSFKDSFPAHEVRGVPVLFFLLFGLLTYRTWGGPISLLSLGGYGFLLFAIWNDKEWDIKAWCLPAAVLFLLYNIAVSSIIGIVMQALSFVFNLVFISSHKRQTIGKTEKGRETKL